MNKYHQLKQKKGFTFLEVLAGILMATTFVLVATQAIVVATVFRVRAQRQSEALNWIQRDLEAIQFQAALSFSSPVGGEEITCKPADNTEMGYGKALMTIVSDSPVESFSTPFVNKSYTVTRTLSVNNRSPYNVVQVSYAVTDPAAPETRIAGLTTEVIADASFDCY